MKDLDFDELDRAVNTLMNDVPKSDLSGSDDDQTKTLSISPTLPDDTAAPASSSVTELVAPVAATTTPAPQARSLTPPATRRGGRFMDVVHHSSDMKKDKPASTKPFSRQGVTIEPVKSSVSSKDVAPSVPSPAPALDANPPVIEKETPPVTSVDTSAPTSDWPDPLDISTPKPSAPSQPEVIVDQPDPMPLLEEGSETAVTAPASDDLQPLTSPFLSGTKVDKRPLGSGQTSLDIEAPEPDHTPVVSDTETELTVDDPSDQLPPSPSETKKDLPPELQGDLVAIESGSTTKAAKLQESTQEEPKEPEQETKSETSPPTALLEATTDDEPAFTGPTSIAQQYKEEPNTGDPKNGAIYDTDTYHKPLAHPAQKKSGWLWVIWIVLILLIGAGAGAALYFLRVI
ncbi:MAG TPA: hypothetical protein VK497_02295 [Candidatus Saccharimonadales bacterium]|nr:hypothetical protein [Candidatus Saccharimonadales bacterium]